MPVITSAQLTRFFQQGELEFSQEKDFLVDRLSLTMVSGTGDYVLPSYVKSIRRITYLGMKLDPLPMRDYRDVFQSATQQGRPFWYIYNNLAQNTIRLYPKPNQNIAAVTNIWDTDIVNGVIVEFFRPSDNQQFALPPYCRNFLLKKYVAKMVHLVEGPSQNLKLAKYYDQQWQFWKNLYFELFDELYNRSRKLFLSEIVSNSYFPAQPVLPIARFGIGVDEGY